MEPAYLRYRVMAYVVGTMLLVLCAVALPLQYVFGHPLFAMVGFDIHGIVFLVYLATVADLSRRRHFVVTRVIAMVASGVIPGLAFVEEHRIAAALRREGTLYGAGS